MSTQGHCWLAPMPALETFSCVGLPWALALLVADMDADESQNPRHSGVFSAFYGWIYVVFSSVAAIVSYLRGGSSHLEALPVFPPEITNEGLEECSHLVVRL